MTGDQPEGTMTVSINKYMSLPDHGKGVIVIDYQLQKGVRNGVYFSGTSRTAYLPDT